MYSGLFVRNTRQLPIKEGRSWRLCYELPDHINRRFYGDGTKETKKLDVGDDAGDCGDVFERMSDYCGWIAWSNGFGEAQRVGKVTQ